jgi:hypothetical protein
MCGTKSSLVTTIKLRNGNIHSKTFIEISTFQTAINGTNVVHTSGVDIVAVLMFECLDINTEFLANLLVGPELFGEGKRCTDLYYNKASLYLKYREYAEKGKVRYVDINGKL